MSIIPAVGIKSLPLSWRFLCEDYQKDGFLIINVKPKIEECIKTIEVYNESNLKLDEIRIDAKVIRG